MRGIMPNYSPRLLSIRGVLGVCLAIVAMSPQAYSKGKKPRPKKFTGIWYCWAYGTDDRIMTSSGDLLFMLNLEQEGDELTGFVVWPDREKVTQRSQIQHAISGKVDGHTIEIHFNTASRGYRLVGNLEKKRLKGEWSADAGRNGKWDGGKHCPQCGSVDSSWIPYLPQP